MRGAPRRAVARRPAPDRRGAGGDDRSGRALGRLNLTDKDVAKISGWIEDDSVTQDVYTERLNMILELGAEADKDAMANVELAGAGNELMALWEQVDRGDVKEDEAFEQADEALRRRNSAMDKEL